MPLKEVTGERKGPSHYSQWHRSNLPAWCYMVDGDWFEMRAPSGTVKVVAYIETIEVKDPSRVNPLWNATKKLVMNMVKKLQIPCFVVWHNADCNSFMVWKGRKNDSNMKKKKLMSEEEYINFLESLTIPKESKMELFERTILKNEKTISFLSDFQNLLLGYPKIYVAFRGVIGLDKTPESENIHVSSFM